MNVSATEERACTHYTPTRDLEQLTAVSAYDVCFVQCKTRKLAIANRSRVSCAHNTESMYSNSVTLTSRLRSLKMAPIDHIRLSIGRSLYVPFCRCRYSIFLIILTECGDHTHKKHIPREAGRVLTASKLPCLPRFTNLDVDDVSVVRRSNKQRNSNKFEK